MRTTGIKKQFLLILTAFIISACMVVLIPFSTGDDGNLSLLGYAAGILFWAGLIAGIIGYLYLYKKGKAVIAEHIDKKRIPSGLRFFSNPPAAVMDAVLIISLAGTIYCALHVTVSQYIAMVFLLLTLAGVYAHFLLNGKIYQYIWNSKKGHQSLEHEERKGQGYEK